MSSFDDWYGILTPYYDDWDDDDDEDKIDWDDDFVECGSSEEDDWKEIQFLIDRIIKRRQKGAHSHEDLR